MATLTPQFEKAFAYAAKLHGGQTRKKTGRPYLGHLMGVTAIVLQYGGDEEQAIAALLHDAVEDCGGKPTLEAIRSRFGDRVAAIVDGCTDAYGEPKPDWRPRKEKYVEHVRTAPLEVVLVSAADKLYNVREIILDYRTHGEGLWPRFNGGREGTLWYYRALVTAFREAVGAHPLVEELDREVQELDRLAAAK